MLDKLITLNTIRGNLTVLRKLLETETDKNLGPAPQDCADFSKPEVIEVLRSAGAFVDDRFHETLLHVAVATKNIESVKLLIEIGYDVNSYNNRNESVLYFAVANEFKEIVELLVEKGANINEQYPKESVLSCAVRIHNEELTKFLLDNGANVDIKNYGGTNPLVYAVTSPSPVITLMIMARAELTPYSMGSINFKYVNSLYSLSFNIRRYNRIGGVSLGGNCYDNIKYLLEREATCSQSRFVKKQALLQALNFGDFFKVKFLLDFGAEIGDDKSERTALHIAAKNDDDDVARCILDFGVDVNARDVDDITPLRIAVLDRNDKVCKLLLSRGANVNIKDCYGVTPLCLAVWYAHSTTVELLLEYGAEVCLKCLSSNVFKKSVKYDLELLMESVNYDIKINNLLIEHVAKLKSLNSWDDKEVLKIIVNNYRMKFHYKKCIKELEKMKIWKVYENISLFNILIENKDMRFGYARNQNLIEALDNVMNQLNHVFPIYYSMLKDFYKETETQRFINRAAIFLSEILHFHDPFHSANLKILNYLSERDIIKINGNE